MREEIHDAGDMVGEELRWPLTKLTEYVEPPNAEHITLGNELIWLFCMFRSFTSVLFLLQKQVHRPFLKRYLKRDDVLRSINVCDAALNDALGLFSVCSFMG